MQSIRLHDKRGATVCKVAFRISGGQTAGMRKLWLILGVVLGVTNLEICFGQGLVNASRWKPLQWGRYYEERGNFKAAEQAFSKALSDTNVPLAEVPQLKFELDRLERIRKDYPYTKDGLFKELKDSVKDLTEAEFEKWIAEGRFDSREIDGERRFMSSSVSNLYFRYQELESRRIKSKDTAAFEKTRLETCRAIARAATEEKKSYVQPKRFHVTMSVTAKPDAAPDGEIIRAWLPIPRTYPFQTDFEITTANPKPKQINSADSPIRAVYFESVAQKEKSTAFNLEYDYTAHAVHFNVNPAEVKPVDPRDASLAPYLKEGPHVQFTPEMRALSKQIAGDETSPYRMAKKFYDWIGENIKYSYATEYSTIRNISEYCHAKGYGDCGQEALLFITLCRMNGIPARWQSGWNTFPNGKSIHDWSEIYLAPYGWMPVDPYMSIWAMRYARTLTPEQKREVRDFYFGGLDQYRMSANSDHNQELNPPKKTMRSDDVDFQRGELEWGDRNIYFDKYSYKLEIKEIKLPRID